MINVINASCNIEAIVGFMIAIIATIYVISVIYSSMPDDNSSKTTRLKKINLKKDF